MTVVLMLSVLTPKDHTNVHVVKVFYYIILIYVIFVKLFECKTVEHK